MLLVGPFPQEHVLERDQRHHRQNHHYHRRHHHHHENGFQRWASDTEGEKGRNSEQVCELPQKLVIQKRHT